MQTMPLFMRDIRIHNVHYQSHYSCEIYECTIIFQLVPYDMYIAVNNVPIPNKHMTIPFRARYVSAPHGVSKHVR